MANEPVVKVEGLTRYFGTKPAALEVSFEVGRGEVFALLGPNGAGKTTLMRMLLGMLEPTRGRAALLGCDCRALTPEIRARTGYLAEGHYLYGWMRIRDLAEFTRGTHPRWNAAQFRAFLEYFRLEDKQKIRALSNGQRAQVSLAVALACDPELLIMDDPTLGVDAGTRRDFLRGVVDLVSHENRAVVFSSHILDDVERIADRIGIIADGVLRVNTTLEAFKAAVVRYHLVFPGEPPREMAVPRTVARSTLGREVFLTVVRPGADTEAALARLGAANCEPAEMSLEDAFVDYTVGGERKLPFGSTASK